MTADAVARSAAALLGAPLAEARALHGGDISTVVRLALEDGRVAVAKTGPAPRREARMLEAMGRAGAPVPQVLAVSDSVLVLSELQDDGALESAGWAELGTALRQLHASRGPAYGWPEDFAFGAVPIPNAATETWPAFWAERRLLPSCPDLPADMATRIEALARNLPDLLPDPPPSLLHGDLWTGNILAASGHLSGLIDPACYHGDPEVDLAMLHLFGSPGGSFSEAYGPLRPGAEARRPIYQLWPALVHVRLFGAGYHSLVSRLLSACGH